MEKFCKNCNQKFSIFDEDRNFLEKISPTFNGTKYKIPDPTHCPDCRQRRRLSFRNERSLYKRKCDLSGKNIISLYSPDKKQKVYETSVWWSDQWDPKDYGRDFDFSRPFFEQFKELLKDVPEIALMNDDSQGSENCAYTNDFAYSKNCYLCFVTWHNEDCYYSTGIHYSKDTVDSLDTMHSELCYECIDCEKCYHCAFLQYCEGCTDCYFGYDLKNCKNCFKCAGLRDKQYYIENKFYSKAEYERILKDAQLSSEQGLERSKKEFKGFLLKVPHRNVFNINCENSIGNKLRNCKNVWGFESYECQDSRFIYHCSSVNDCFDITNTGKAELCYETLVSNDAYGSLFTNECWNTNNSFYCNHCFHSDYLFGCSGLKKHKYCIFNKQYSKGEYEILVPKIIEHMKNTGEWGEFFPMKISPFDYNETTAQEYFPQEKGGNDGVKTKKPFKIIDPESRFYRRLNLPNPKINPEQRHLDRLSQRYPRKLWRRKCAKCMKEILAGYPEDRPETVYCQKCYLEKIN